MQIQDWLSVIDQIPSGSRVTITGGEPLIYNGFEQIIFAANEKKIDINIITNGVFIEKLVNVLMQTNNVKSISISIDSIGNYTRNMKKVDYDKMIKNIKLLQSLRVDNSLEYSIDVKSVVLEECIGKYKDLIKYLLDDIKVDSVSLQLLKGSSIQHSDFSYEYDEIFNEPVEFYKYKNLSKLKHEIKSIKKYVSNNLSERKVYMHPKFEDMTIMNFDEDNFISMINNKSTHDFKKCKYPWSSAHINADGDVFPCLSISFGNVRYKELVNIFDSKVAGLFRNRIYKNGHVPACARCGWLKV